MAALDVWYASAGQDILFETLEVTDGVVTKRITPDYGIDNLTVTLENSSVVDFEREACVISRLPKTENDIQSYAFTIQNIHGTASKLIRDALAARRTVELTRRLYLSSDLDAPAAEPEVFTMLEGSYNNRSLTMQAGYYNLLDTYWPRQLFLIKDFAGLQYV